MKLAAIAQQLNGDIDPHHGDLDITGVAPMEEATATEITFLSNPKYIAKLGTCQAGAILVAHKFDHPSLTLPLVRVADPYLAFAQALALFYPPTPAPAAIHSTAVLGQGVTLGDGVSVGPYTVIGDGVTLGDGVVIHSHCTLYPGVQVGAGSVIHSHVAIREGVILGQRVIVQNGTVLGADGFGFVPMADGTFHKIPQVGTVVIGDDVEVQALSAIDRATVGTTAIGAGTKVDNLVQVAHGCKIGQNSLLCGQVGLAGSTVVGNSVILAGQVGSAGHITIGDGAVVTAGTGLAQSVPPGAQVSGTPEMDHKLWLRASLALRSLPEMLQRLRRLEKRLGQDSGRG